MSYYRLYTKERRAYGKLYYETHKEERKQYNRKYYRKYYKIHQKRLIEKNCKYFHEKQETYESQLKYYLKRLWKMPNILDLPKKQAKPKKIAKTPIKLNLTVYFD